MDNQLLKDYVATANSGKYQSNDEVYSKFPEFSDVDPQVLNDYVATANSGKYESVDKLNEKFPEFSTPPETEEAREEGLDEFGNTSIDGFVQPKENQKDKKEAINPYTVGLNKNVKTAFTAKNAITKENRKVVASAVENYFSLENMPKRELAPYDGESDYRSFANSEEDDIKAYFGEAKYNEYKLNKEKGTLPSSDDYKADLNQSQKTQQKLAMESVINDMPEDERAEAILLLPDIIDDDSKRIVIEGKTYENPQELYNYMIKKSPGKAMRFQQEYLSQVNKDYTSEVKKYNKEIKAFETENSELFTEQTKISEDFKKLGHVTEKSSTEEIEAYNNLYYQQEDLNLRLKQKGVDEKSKSFSNTQGSLREKFDDMMNKSKTFSNSSMAATALSLDYSLSGRISLQMEKSFIAGGAVLGRGGLKLIGKVTEAISTDAKASSIEAKEYYAKIDKNYQNAINYYDEVGAKIQTNLPTTIKADDITTSNVFRAAKQMLGNNSPSILVALGTGGLTGFGAASVGMATRKKIANLSMATFFQMEAGGKLGDMEVAQKYATENIASLEKMLLNPDLTPDQVIEYKKAIEENENALSFTGFDKAFSSIMYGGIAAYAERLGTLSYVNGLNKASKVVKGGFVKKALYGAGGNVFNMGVELAEETVTTLGHNLIDIVALKEDKSLIEGLDKDFVVNTLFTSLAIQGPSMGMSSYNVLKGEVNTMKQRSESRARQKELFEITDMLKDGGIVNQKQRKLLVERKREILKEAALEDVMTVQKVARMNKKEVTDLFESNRLRRKALNELQELGSIGDAQDPFVQKQKEELINDYNKHDSAREFLLAANSKRNEKLMKDVAKQQGLELGVDIDPQNEAEMMYNLGKFQFNEDVVKNIIKEKNVKVFDGENAKVDLTNYLTQLVSDGKINEADKAEALKGEKNAMNIGGEIVLMKDNIHKGIMAGGAAGLFAAEAPLHELLHMDLKKAGIVTKGDKIAKNSLEAVKSIQKNLNDKITNGLIDSKTAKILQKRIDQYTNPSNNEVNLEEMITLVGDLKSAGVISRETQDINYDLKRFFKGLAGKAFGDKAMFLDFKTIDDIFRYVDSFQDQAKAQTLVIPPDEDKKTKVKESKGVDLSKSTPEQLVKIIKRGQNPQRVKEAYEALTPQFDLLALKALNYDTRKGDIDRDSVIAEARKFLVDRKDKKTGKIMPGIAKRFTEINPETGEKRKFSTFVTANMAPKKPQIYEATKTLQDRTAKKLDSPDVQELAGDVNTTTNTENVFVEKIDVLGFATVAKVADKIKALVKVKLGDTFKQIIQNYAGKVGELVFDVPAKKIMEGGANLAAVTKYTEGMPAPAEAQNIQKFFNAANNAERFIKTLPLYNVTDKTADINKVGENLEVSRDTYGYAIGLKGLPLDYFYENYTDPKALSKDPKVYEQRVTSKAGRSMGLTSQTPMKRLKPQFRKPTPEVVEQFKKDIGITPKGEESVYSRDIGQLLKGVAKVYSINAALSAAQRVQEAKTKVAPVAEKQAIKQQTADITAAQSKIAFSLSVIGNIDNMHKGIINTTFEGDLNRINKITNAFIGEDIFKHGNQTEINDYFEAFEITILGNLPGNMFGANPASVFSQMKKSKRVLPNSGKDEITLKDGRTVTVNDYFDEKRNILKKKIQDGKVTFGKPFKGKGADYVYGKSYADMYAINPATKKPFKSNDPRYAKAIEKAFHDGTREKYNEIHASMHKQFMERVAASIRDNNQNVKVWGNYFSFVGQDAKHAWRMGAEWVLYSKNPIGAEGKLYEWEHAMMATRSYLYLLETALTKVDGKYLDFNLAYEQVMENYKLIALDNYDDKVKLGGSGRQKTMGKNWQFLVNSWLDRYFDLAVAAIKGKNGYGINPKSLIGKNRKTAAEIYNVANIGKIIQDNKLVEKKLEQGLVISGKVKASKGITILDFDDTLATSKSLVKYTKPDGTTGTLNAEQYASTYENLSDLGYVFDFSEFNKVVDGKIAPLFQKALKLQNKFGPQNMFVLTARPPQAQQAIFDFLTANGLNIPLENITGLANSTSEAKAMWVAEKVSLGFNDFYFADDALQNVQAVKNVLDQFDVKSKIQQARVKFSEGLDVQINEIIQQNENIGAEKVFSKAEAQLRGAKKGKMKFYIPPGAEDFMGLMYTIANARGKKGEAQVQFFVDNILNPYQKGVRKINSARQAVQDDYKALLKEFPDVKDRLRETIPGMNFTIDAAIRVYLWDKAGFDIPDISKSAKDKILKYIKGDQRLIAFGDTVGLISKRKEGYTKPETDWVAQTILSDLDVATNMVGRKEFLNEFIENVDLIFNQDNLNKLEAIYGADFVEALKDMIFRMKTGKNRSSGQTDKQVARWTTWISNSVGAIMFLNMRSALLQTISAVNFVNWSDNNPAKAAAALANLPQFTKDFAMLFNSDYLKQRRSGLRTDVNEAALANSMAGKKNKVNAMLAYLLKKGFTPTQVADSFAIASGGATFYRNRVDSLMKNGMNKAQAEEQAFADFQAIAEVSQQSADPSLISKQQASILGRFILAFQNTPMQYARITKKAAVDLIKGRGDWKTNVSKIVYYAAIQNIIFSALQSALFALAFSDKEDEDEKDKKIERLTNTVIDSLLRGTGIYGAVAATAKNIMLEFWRQDNKGYRADHAYTLLQFANISPPIGSKLRKLYSATQTRKFNKRAMEKMGYTFNNPIVPAVGLAVEAFTNVPLGRAITKINNAKAALGEDVEMWQRMALIMGWNTWDLNVEDPNNIKKYNKKKKSNTSSAFSKKKKSNVGSIFK